MAKWTKNRHIVEDSEFDGSETEFLFFFSTRSARRPYIPFLDQCSQAVKKGVSQFWDGNPFASTAPTIIPSRQLGIRKKKEY
jgi:hypothetical protein